MKPEHGEALQALLALPEAPDIVLLMAKEVGSDWSTYGRSQPIVESVLDAYYEDVVGKCRNGEAISLTFLSTNDGPSFVWALSASIMSKRETCPGIGCDGKCIRDILDGYFGSTNLVLST